MKLDESQVKTVITVHNAHNEEKPAVAGVINSIPRHDLSKEFKKLFQIRAKNLLGNKHFVGQRKSSIDSVDHSKASKLLPPLNNRECVNRKEIKSTLSELYKS
eukprot:TRINITY_DN16260_c0_g1_i1.p1 TRINITY_DN16260_c0_g1~~TRINITY_DN16260_c0_g1_i1.p1  ORF type:complete len:103 (-),score=20.96 TRINITY_DN16260_c0_g1_i1:163-471(-)